MSDYYVTEHGTTAHRRRDCPALDGATVNGVLTEQAVEDAYHYRKCESCRYAAPTLDEHDPDLDSMTVREAVISR